MFACLYQSLSSTHNSTCTGVYKVPKMNNFIDLSYAIYVSCFGNHSSDASVSPWILLLNCYYSFRVCYVTTDLCLNQLFQTPAKKG